MQRNAMRGWIVVAVVAGGSFAACDARIHVLDADERVAVGGGAECGAPDGSGTRTGDAREVRDMTHDEAVAWCQNYIDNIYAARADGSLPGTQSTFPGYVVGSVAYCRAVDGCVVGAGVEDCVANLLHAPCEATIVQLNACLPNFLMDDGCGAGCYDFMSAPHCSETVISRIGPPVTDGAGGGDECYLRTSKGCG
jgi:hypothetical protein